MIAEIELERIESNPWQPRKEFNEQELLELGESIKTEGLKQAIGLRPHPKKKGMFQLIWGERRVRASKLVGLKTIRAEVQSANDLQMKKWEGFRKASDTIMEMLSASPNLLAEAAGDFASVYFMKTMQKSLKSLMDIVSKRLKIKELEGGKKDVES